MRPEAGTASPGEWELRGDVILWTFATDLEVVVRSLTQRYFHPYLFRSRQLPPDGCCGIQTGGVGLNGTSSWAGGSLTTGISINLTMMQTQMWCSCIFQNHLWWHSWLLVTLDQKRHWINICLTNKPAGWRRRALYISVAIPSND